MQPAEIELPVEAPKRSGIRAWHVAVGLCVLLFLSGLGGYQLIDPDEGRYAEITREMLARHDFILPTLNYVPYLEKPPLLYWMTALSLKIFGEHSWAIRLVPAIAAILGLLVMWWLALLTLPKAVARWAPVVLGSTFFYFVMARLPVIDMLFSMLFAAALTAWYAGWKSDKKLPLWVLSGVFFGLAVLAKGPVALVLGGGIILVFLAWERQLRHLPYGVILPGLVACLTAAPWFILVQQRYPYFNYYFFVVQHIHRFLGDGLVEHRHPFYYFVPVILLGMGGWSVFWPKALVGLKARLRGWDEQTKTTARFLTTWSAFIVLFFSASSCKLTPYILPCWWPLAAATTLLAWQVLQPHRLPRFTRWLGYFLAGTVLLLDVALGVFLSVQHTIPSYALVGPRLVGVTCWTLAGLGLLTLPRWGNINHRLMLIAGMSLLAFAGTLPAYHAFADHRDMGGLIPRALRPGIRAPGWVLAQYRCYNQSFNFYTHARIILIDAVSELKLGPREPDAGKWFLKGRETIDRLSNEGPLALVVRSNYADSIAKAHKLYIWARNRDRAMLFNRQGLELVSQVARSRGMK